MCVYAQSIFTTKNKFANVESLLVCIFELDLVYKNMAYKHEYNYVLYIYYKYIYKLTRLLIIKYIYLLNIILTK